MKVKAVIIAVGLVLALATVAWVFYISVGAD